MNPIEEMMERLGVKKKTMCEWTCKDSEFCNASCEHYETKQDVYPPFTPEKQLEIIKLIGCYITKNYIRWGEGATYSGYFDPATKTYRQQTDWAKSYYYEDQKSFECALAQLTTELVQAQRVNIQQIKEILEG